MTNVITFYIHSNTQHLLKNTGVHIQAFKSGRVSCVSGSVRFLVHKYVNRRARRSQSEYISEEKMQPVVIELEPLPM